MPPWAHTEWERLTGTMENRSTCPPISAILITAASPASPPPTTIILGAAMLARPLFLDIYMDGVRNVAVLREVQEPIAKGVQARESDDRQEHEKGQAQPKQSLLCFVSGNDAPLRTKEPYSIRKVPGGRDKSDDVERHQPRILYFASDLRKRGSWVIVEVDSREPHRVGMPDDIDERDTAGPALERVHPIATPGIGCGVRISAEPDIKTVEAMVCDGKPDTEQLEKEYQRQIREKAHLACVGGRPANRRRIRDQNVFEKERTDGNDSSKRMQPAKYERYPLTST